MIVPELINSEGIEIFDSNNVRVKLCNPSQFKFVNRFTNPFFYIDNFEKELIKSCEIRRIDMFELEKIGFRLVSLRPESQMRWYPRQLKIYMLESKNKIIPKSEILSKIPNEHFIELDVTNNRLRIKGRNGGYPHIRNEGAGQWVNI